MHVPYEERARQIPFASAEYLRFASRQSFLGVPAKRIDEIAGAGAVIVGAPFDWGVTYRPGARFGPKAIREADYGAMDGYRPHLPTGIDALGVLGVVDIGDVYVVPGQIEESIRRIADAVETVSRSGAVPIVLGGDHTITYPNATGVARVHGFGDVGLVHFDAHADAGNLQNGYLYGHGTPMRRLIESGAVPGHRFVQIGNAVPPIFAAYLAAHVLGELFGGPLSDALPSTASRGIEITAPTSNSFSSGIAGRKRRLALS